MSDSQQEASGPNKPDVVFAQCVRMAREAAGLTQQQLGAAMGAAGYPMRQNTVSKIEAAERPVIIGEAVALAGILGTSVADLLTPPPEGEDVKAAVTAAGWHERNVQRLLNETDRAEAVARAWRVELDRARYDLADAKKHLDSLRRGEEVTR